VVAAIDGDMEAADNVQLVLPETGIYESDSIKDGVPCCGSSSVDKQMERTPIGIRLSSGGCCGPRA
jgi:hypothetical protein